MRKIGVFLLGLGAFFVVLGLMVRFYAYPQLAVAPVNPDSTTVLVGEDATIFDIGTLEEIPTTLHTEVITIGDEEATEEAGGDTVVWVSKGSTRSSDGEIRSRTAERVAMHRVTGEAINCCGAYDEVAEGEREAVTREGLVFKFPFNSQKEDYDFWDGDTGQAYPAKYVRTEDVEGLETYVYEQVVPKAIVGSVELPADLLGEEGDENLTADMTYSNTRTFWVEPETGGLVNRTEKQFNTIAYDGTDRITTTDALVKFTADQVSENVETYESSASSLKMLRTTLPLALGILGLVLLLASVLLGRRKSAEA